MKRTCRRSVVRLTVEEMTGGLTEHVCLFIYEYVKDFNVLAAAERCSIHPDEGRELLARDDVQAAIQAVQRTRDHVAEIDDQWLLLELVDNHRLARQQGKIGVSNNALVTIGKLARVDAFAAEKVMQVSDEQIVERLARARQRADERLQSESTEGTDSETSFL